MVKTELDVDIYQAFDINLELNHIQSEEQNGYFLNPNELQTQDAEAQVYGNNIKIVNPLGEFANLEDIYEYHATNPKSDDPKSILFCSLCGYRTHQVGRMRVHILHHKKTLTLGAIIMCEKCDYQTKNEANMKVHSRRHEKAEDWIEGLPNEESIIQNIRSSFGKKYIEKDQLLQCPDCNYKTMKPGYFRLHLQRHKARKAEPGDLMCELCGYQTTKKSNLYLHKRRHKEKKEGNPKFDHHDHFLFQESYKCKSCDFLATNKPQLYRHNAKHKKPEERRTLTKEEEVLKCGDCDHKSTSRHLFDNHLKSHSFFYTTNDTFKCSQCNFQTIRKNSLKNHMARRHTLDEVNMNRCEDCSYESLHKEDFKKHLLIHKPPEELEMSRCPECDYETLHRGNLRTHIIRHHRKDDEMELFRCYNCTYSSRFKCQLKDHMNIHRQPNVQAMEKCPYCGFETMSRKNCLRHIRRQHKGEKIPEKVKGF